MCDIGISEYLQNFKLIATKITKSQIIMQFMIMKTQLYSGNLLRMFLQLEQNLLFFQIKRLSAIKLIRLTF